MKRLLYRVLSAAGLRVERHRDPYVDMARLAGDVRVAIDGGAYHGGASRTMLKLFPNAKVHAFEANPELAAALVSSLTDPRFTLHASALSDSVSMLDFYLPTKDFTGSLLKPGAEMGASRRLTVSATTMNESGLSPDVVKLDLQGAELLALRGASAILPNVRAVLCEVNFVSRYDGCALFHEIAALLSGHGMRLFRLYEVHAAKSGQLQFADALFVRH